MALSRVVSELFNVEKYRDLEIGVRGQSGQAIKLFQITPYVNDFQTLNKLGSGQPVGASKNSFIFRF